jgi:hypothetical protein
VEVTTPQREALWSGFEDGPPELPPIIATEKLDGGWRGLTEEGEVYTVKGHKVPESILVARGGRVIGSRRITAVDGIDISAYLEHFGHAVELHKAGKNLAALITIDRAIEVANTLRARFNRAMILLSLGRWPEGIAEFEECERSPPFQRPASRIVLEAGLAPWQGEDISGKRLLLIHDHGLGDTVMMLRFVPALTAMGVDVVMFVPPELTRIAAQFGMVIATNSLEIAAQGCDYFTSFLYLLRWLTVTPSTVPAGPYVTADPALVARWRSTLPDARRRVGIAWSVGAEQPDDFPRSLPVAELVARFGDTERVAFHSLQIQDRAAAGEAGVLYHEFADLADCAALMSLMDEVVSVDTAAIHLAGAIGHPRATLLLPRWHSWRWHGNPFYPTIRIETSGR